MSATWCNKYITRCHNYAVMKAWFFSRLYLSVLSRQEESFRYSSKSKQRSEIALGRARSQGWCALQVVARHLAPLLHAAVKKSSNSANKIYCFYFICFLKIFIFCLCKGKQWMNNISFKWQHVIIKMSQIGLDVFFYITLTVFILLLGCFGGCKVNCYSCQQS